MAVQCLPEQIPCGYRGLGWFDWAWSLFKQLCNVQGWLGAIQDNTSVAAFGNVPIKPAYAQISVTGAVQTVTIPVGALEIQAVIDEEYAADFALVVVTDAGDKALPAGCDLHLPNITPVFIADTNGQDVTQGIGTYPETQVKYPAGSKGFVTAIYKTTAATITIA